MQVIPTFHANIFNDMSLLYSHYFSHDQGDNNSTLAAHDSC
jgi:hypothetical protein